MKIKFMKYLKMINLILCFIQKLYLILGSVKMKLKDKKRDLRISNKKLRENGIYFDNTGETIVRCIKEFNR